MDLDFMAEQGEWDLGFGVGLGMGLKVGRSGVLTCELSTKSMWRIPQPKSTLATAHPNVPARRNPD